MIRAQKLKQEILDVLKSKGVDGENTETLIESIAVGFKRHLQKSESRLTLLLTYLSLLNEIPQIYLGDNANQIYHVVNEAILKELGLIPNHQNKEIH